MRQLDAPECWATTNFPQYWQVRRAGQHSFQCTEHKGPSALLGACTVIQLVSEWIEIGSDLWINTESDGWKRGQGSKQRTVGGPKWKRQRQANSLHHYSRKICQGPLVLLYLSAQAEETAVFLVLLRPRYKMDIAIQPCILRSWPSYFPTSRIFDQHFGDPISEAEMIPSLYYPRPSFFRWPSWVDSGLSEVSFQYFLHKGSEAYL